MPERTSSQPAPAHRMHVLVLGCGPAGLFAAVALAERGVEVTVLAPDPGRAWPNRYGAWVPELEATGLAEFASERWADPIFATPARRQGLGRPYARVDGEALRQRALARLREAGGRCIDERVEDVAAAMRLYAADLVVDASGVPGRKPGPRVLRWQHAYGLEIEVEGAPLGGSMSLMDWTPPSRATAEEWAQRPSFLYAMDLGQGRIFVEETELVSATPLPLATLAGRLLARLGERGIEAKRVLDVERCRLPMAIAPVADEPGVVAFGARAGLIHPATGYSLTRSAAIAPRLAAAVSTGAAAGLRGEALARRARKAVRSARDRRVDALLDFGGALIATWSADDICRFFEAFFSLGEAEWSGLLERSLGPWQLGSVMARVERASPASIRRQLWRAGWQERQRLGAALFGTREQQTEVNP